MLLAPLEIFHYAPGVPFGNLLLTGLAAEMEIKYRANTGFKAPHVSHALGGSKTF
jgi:hypothetical protein